MDVTGLIPARGGSRGKNLWPLAGKPLLLWTIEAARASSVLTRLVVSTDSDEVAALARTHGVDVLERPAELARDETPTRDVVLHALRELGPCEVVVLLQPTSPLRRGEHVDEAVRSLREQDADAVVSVVEVPHQFRPSSLMSLVEGRLVPLDPDAPVRRQDKPVVYARNGPAVLVLRPDRLRDDLYGGDCRPYVMEPRDSVDIDELFDLRLAEYLLTEARGVSSLDRETGRDRYFAAKERELDALLDPVTGLVSERFARPILCPLCGAGGRTELFVKRGYPIVRCDECTLVFANPQVDEELVLAEYRAKGERANDLWIDVLTSKRQLELDGAKFAEILDELEPYRGEGRLLDVGTSIGLFLHLAQERGWSGIGTEYGVRALAYAREQFGLEVHNRPLAELGIAPGSLDVVTLNSVLEHVNRPLELLAEVRELLRPGGALFLIVPNVESLACRVLHEHAATFDGRNHLVYFSRATLRDALARSGFTVVQTHTRVGAIDAVLEWLAYREPHGGADLEDDALAAVVRARRAEVDRLLEELDLGYKLHCLAVRKA